MSRNLIPRLEALEKRQGAAGRQIILWRGYDDEHEYQARLAEAHSKCGLQDSVLVVSWLPVQDAPYAAKVIR